MKTTVSIYDFRREFAQCRPDNFSYEGLGILFDYLEELGDSCGQEIELDVIALCCEWNEDTPENIAADYSIDIEDDGNALANVLDHLNDQTMIAGVTDAGTIVYLVY
jgi:DNA integrity scanning protein DisA with diadenylate cyclase activity